MTVEGPYDFAREKFEAANDRDPVTRLFPPDVPDTPTKQEAEADDHKDERGRW